MDEWSSRRVILVVGAGAIGGLLAAGLSDDPQNDVVLAVRRSTPRLELTTDAGVAELSVRLIENPRHLEPVDWVVVATKSYDVGQLGRWLSADCCSTARVAVAQNGIEHVERMERYVERDRVLPLVVTYGAERVGPGRIVKTLDGVVRAPDTMLGRDFMGLAERTSIRVEVAGDFPRVMWEKLCSNLVANSLSAITDLPVREIARRPELRVLARRLAEECRAVAEAHGVTMAAGTADRLLQTLAAYPAQVRSSMNQDQRAGRPLEYDAIGGAVVRAAESVGVDTPCSSTVTALLESISAR